LRHHQSVPVRPAVIKSADPMPLLLLRAY